MIHLLAESSNRQQPPLFGRRFHMLLRAKKCRVELKKLRIDVHIFSKDAFK